MSHPNQEGIVVPDAYVLHEVPQEAPAGQQEPQSYAELIDEVLDHVGGEGQSQTSELRPSPTPRSVASAGGAQARGLLGVPDKFRLDPLPREDFIPPPPEGWLKVAVSIARWAGSILVGRQVEVPTPPKRTGFDVYDPELIERDRLAAANAKKPGKAARLGKHLLTWANNQ